MIQYLIVGLFAILASLGGSFAMIQLAGPGNAPAEKAEEVKQYEYLRLPPMTVPVVDNGKLTGYVVAQFGFSADKGAAGSLSIPGEVVFADEVLKAIFARQHFDLLKRDKTQLGALTAAVAEAVNRRLGVPLVADVLTESMNFVSVDNIRCGSQSARP